MWRVFLNHKMQNPWKKRNKYRKQKNKGKSLKMEKIFITYNWKWLLYRIKKLHKSVKNNIIKHKWPNRKMVKRFTQTLPQTRTSNGQWHRRRCVLVNRGIKIRIIMRYYFIPTRRAKIQIIDHNKFSKWQGA